MEKNKLDKLEKEAKEKIKPIPRRKSFVISAQQFMKLYGKAFILIADPKSKEIVMGYKMKTMFITFPMNKKTGKTADIITPLLNSKSNTNFEARQSLLRIIDKGIYSFSRAMTEDRSFRRRFPMMDKIFKGPKGWARIGKPKNITKRKREKANKKKGRKK